MADKYKVTKADGTDLPFGEPVFVLRAQDIHSVGVLKEYIQNYKHSQEYCAIFNCETDVMYNQLCELLQEFQTWPIKKLPD